MQAGASLSASAPRLAVREVWGITHGTEGDFFSLWAGDTPRHAKFGVNSRNNTSKTTTTSPFYSSHFVSYATP